MSRGRTISFEERECISRSIAVGISVAGIARRLGRDSSVISREIARHDGRDSYSAIRAQEQAERSRTRPREFKLETDTRLHDEVNQGLTKAWSPQQISRRLREEYPDDDTMRVSHETIYRTLFVQARGHLRTQLKMSLRTGRAGRTPHGSTRPKVARIKDMVMITERPADVEDRAVPGHWEGDLIVGKGNKSQILTLVERNTRFVILQKIPYDKNADRVAVLLAEAIEKLPTHLKRSITWDQGTEMAAHSTFTVATNIPIYFCDPHSPWQRGSNENTNGLLRQFFPKGTDLSIHSQNDLNHVADLLNGRPRQTLHWKTPTEKLNKIMTH